MAMRAIKCGRWEGGGSAATCKKCERHRRRRRYRSVRRRATVQRSERFDAIRCVQQLVAALGVGDAEEVKEGEETCELRGRFARRSGDVEEGLGDALGVKGAL